jgi:hypothetical protein
MLKGKYTAYASSASAEDNDAMMVIQHPAVACTIKTFYGRN